MTACFLSFSTWVSSYPTLSTITHWAQLYIQYTYPNLISLFMPEVKTTTVSGEKPSEYEAEHVHDVYDKIASHFSSTRYKPWPIIAAFLSSLPIGSVGLDSGTGNGKYLPLPIEHPNRICTIGMDRSLNLLHIARTAGGSGHIREVVWGDVLGRSWRDGAFDYAISIATIHHLSTHARRLVATQRLIQAISPAHGRALIYVWAVEQDNLSKRKIPNAGHPPESSKQGHDVFVPWVFTQQSHSVNCEDRPSPSADTGGASQDKSTQVFNRYYHMFAKGELRMLVEDAARTLGLIIGSKDELNGDNAEGQRCMDGVEIVQDGWERSNYYIELRRWREG